MATQDLSVTLGLNSSPLAAGLKAAKYMVAGFAAYMGAITIKGFLEDATKEAGNFEFQMAHLAGVTEGTTADLNKLANMAKEVGPKFGTSAVEMAKGMVILGQAGFETQDIMKSMNGIMKLTIAGQLDMARASDIVVRSLYGFGMRAGYTNRVVNSLGYIAAKTNATIDEFGEGMAYVAPIARMAGWDIEQVAAALGIMANAGIKGSMGGTSLRAVLAGLLNPTEQEAQLLRMLGAEMENTDGSLKVGADMVDALTKAFGTGEIAAKAMMAVFGQRGGPGGAALLQAGGDKFRELEAGARKSADFVDKYVARILATYNNAVDRLKAIGKNLLIAAGDTWLEPLKKVVDVDIPLIANAITNALKDANKKGEMTKYFNDMRASVHDFAVGAAEYIKTGKLPESLDGLRKDLNHTWVTIKQGWEEINKLGPAWKSVGDAMSSVRMVADGLYGTFKDTFGYLVQTVEWLSKKTGETIAKWDAAKATNSKIMGVPAREIAASGGASMAPSFGAQVFENLPGIGGLATLDRMATAGKSSGAAWAGGFVSWVGEKFGQVIVRPVREALNEASDAFDERNGTAPAKRGGIRVGGAWMEGFEEGMENGLGNAYNPVKSNFYGKSLPPEGALSDPKGIALFGQAYAELLLNAIGKTLNAKGELIGDSLRAALELAGPGGNRAGIIANIFSKEDISVQKAILEKAFEQNEEFRVKEAAANAYATIAKQEETAAMYGNLGEQATTFNEAMNAKLMEAQAGFMTTGQLWAQTVMDVFGQIEMGITQAVMSVVQGTGTMAAVFKQVGMTILQTMVQTFIKIQIQHMISSRLQKKLEQEKARAAIFAEAGIAFSRGAAFGSSLGPGMAAMMGAACEGVAMTGLAGLAAGGALGDLTGGGGGPGSLETMAGGGNPLSVGGLDFTSTPVPTDFQWGAAAPIENVAASMTPYKLAEGGVVDRPTLAILGEGGEREWVIPESKMGNGTTVIEMNVHVHLPAGDVVVSDRVGVAIAETVSRLVKSSDIELFASNAKSAQAVEWGA